MEELMINPALHYHMCALENLLESTIFSFMAFLMCPYPSLPPYEILLLGCAEGGLPVHGKVLRRSQDQPRGRAGVCAAMRAPPPGRKPRRSAGDKRLPGDSRMCSSRLGVCWMRRRTLSGSGREQL